jgi:hypothetical protein
MAIESGAAPAHLFSTTAERLCSNSDQLLPSAWALSCIVRLIEAEMALSGGGTGPHGACSA